MATIDDFCEVVFDEATIQARVKELARQITEDYKDRSLIVLTVQKGADNFSYDLRKAMVEYSVRTYGKLVVDIIPDIAIVSSFRNPTDPKIPTVVLDTDPNIKYDGRDVLIVEDIVERGLTLDRLEGRVRERNPSSVKICSFLNKPGKRRAEVAIDYLGFTAPDKFLVGYGLDYKDHLRDAPFIGIPTEAAKEKYK